MRLPLGGLEELMRRPLLVEVGEGLDGLRDEGEVASTALLRQLLHEVE